MLVLVTYDVNTETAAGRRRLARVARVCKDYGQRAQKSVFECVLGDTGITKLRTRLRKEIDPKKDSLRFYFLDERARGKIEHYGSSAPPDQEAPLIV